MTSAMEWIILVLLHRASGSLPDRSTTGCHSPWFCHNPTMMKTVTYLITYLYRGNEFVARIETDSLTMARRLAGAVLPSRAKVTKIETV
jgi:hypothetical protein